MNEIALFLSLANKYMKYLSQYMEARQTEAFDKAKAFFAFGQNQFDEKKQE
jgi:hypothetical protein